MLSFWYSDSQCMTACWNLLEAFYLRVIFIYSYVIVTVLISAVFLLHGWCGRRVSSLISGFHSMSEFQLAPDQSGVLNRYEFGLVWKKLYNCRFSMIFILTNSILPFQQFCALWADQETGEFFFLHLWEYYVKLQTCHVMSGLALWKVL